MNTYVKFFLIITILSAIYLGIDGLFDFDLLKFIFKTNTVFIDILKIFFGFSGFVSILALKKD